MFLNFWVSVSIEFFVIFGSMRLFKGGVISFSFLFLLFCWMRKNIFIEFDFLMRLFLGFLFCSMNNIYIEKLK